LVERLTPSEVKVSLMKRLTRATGPIVSWPAVVVVVVRVVVVLAKERGGVMVVVVMVEVVVEDEGW